MTLPMLILLPGLDGTGEFFQPLLNALPRDIRTHIVRYPLTGAVDYATCSELARGSLPTDQPYVLLGESFSGPIAISLAAMEPRGLRGVILCATFAANPRPRLSIVRPLLPYMPFHGSGASIRLSRYLVLGRWITPALRELHRRILETVPASTLRQRLEAVAACDVSDALQRIRVPILCMVARHDRLIPRSAGRWMRQRAPGAAWVELDAPHCLLQCAPNEAAKVIGEFLQSLS